MIRKEGVGNATHSIHAGINGGKKVSIDFQATSEKQNCLRGAAGIGKKKEIAPPGEYQGGQSPREQQLEGTF